MFFFCLFLSVKFIQKNRNQDKSRDDRFKTVIYRLSVIVGVVINSQANVYMSEFACVCYSQLNKRWDTKINRTRNAFKVPCTRFDI